jgi:signal transduction histidine kinase
MLADYLDAKRLELIDRCKAKVLLRPREETSQTLLHGIPQFLEQLIETLRIEQAPHDGNSERLSGLSGAWRPIRSDLGEAAALHGRELLVGGYSVDAVVHDYGDLCQAVTELACECDMAVTVTEFRTLNRCLDNAIADAVKEYAYGRKVLFEREALALKERHASLIHELRNQLHSATLAFALVRDGGVTPNGSTGAVIDRSLKSMAALVDRAIIEARTGVAGLVQSKPMSLSGFIADMSGSAALQAEERGCRLVVSEVDPTLGIDADVVLLSGAVSNLLDNAFKFTQHATAVCLDAYATGDRILISVSDHCGGMSPAAQDEIFQPFVQCDSDRSGLGLGLSISRRYVEASHGTLTYRNVPGEGCIFTIALPRHRVQPETADVSPPAEAGRMHEAAPGRP